MAYSQVDSFFFGATLPASYINMLDAQATAVANADSGAPSVTLTNSSPIGRQKLRTATASVAATPNGNNVQNVISLNDFAFFPSVQVTSSQWNVGYLTPVYSDNGSNNGRFCIVTNSGYGYNVDYRYMV